MAIFDQENKNYISTCKFFSILGHQTLDPDPGSGPAIRKNAGSGSGSALNQCGSETLMLNMLDISFLNVQRDEIRTVGYLPKPYHN
jgi:hypothetical protein